ncbi:hypothetical protein QBC39DRAFT_93903 [Podospora conica]|nr:hypothetical protein QBC39DRAFT_93903 [Schizothecium conicum]
MAIRETHGCRDSTSDGDTSPCLRHCPGFHVPLDPPRPPISTSQDGHQHIRTRTTATPFPTEGFPLLFCFPEWLGFALMLPLACSRTKETQAWVRPLNLPCMTMLQSSRRASPPPALRRSSSPSPPPCSAQHPVDGQPALATPHALRAKSETLARFALGESSTRPMAVSRRARSLCFLRPTWAPGRPVLPAPLLSIRQRFHGGLPSDTHRMLAPPPSRIDSCLPEILGARLPLMPCRSVHPRRRHPSGLYISMSGAPSVSAFVSPHPLTSSTPTIFFQSFSSELCSLFASLLHFEHF